MRYLLVLGTVFACAAIPHPPETAPRVTARIVSGGASAADTLIMSAQWTNSMDDGRGPADSLRVRFVGILNDTSYIFKPAPFPTSQTRRHVIPEDAYVGSSNAATYDVFAQVTTYRRKRNSVPLTSVVVPIVLLDAAPLPVTGLTFSAVKKP